jgi:hypothetical protein
VPLVLLRLWLPDRPGALGQVASRIGSLRGDVVGIDILERGAGRVVDELIVELAEGVPHDLLVREVCQVDGVDVEEVRDLDGAVPDPRLDALDDAVALVAAGDEGDLLRELTGRVRRTFAADWALVIDDELPSIRAVAGQGLPPAPWLAAFSSGVRGHPTAGAAVAAGDLVCVPMAGGPQSLLVSRAGRPFRARERRQLAAVAVIAAARFAELRVRRPLSGAQRA